MLLFGVAARGLVGSLTLVGPSDRYEDWLGLGETAFKLDGLYWAGEHFEHGMNVVWRKSLLAHAMTALFAAEVVVLLSWIASEVQV